MRIEMKSRGLRPLLRVAAALLAVAAAAPASAQDDPTGSWAMEVSGHQFREGGAASDGAFLYVVGGDQTDGILPYPQTHQKTRRYDPVNDTWMSLSAYPYPVIGNAVAHHNGRLFSFGGTNLNLSTTDDIVRYTISADSWEVTGAKLSSPRFDHAVTTRGNSIHVAGGFSGTAIAATNQHDEFDAVNETIASRATLPVALMNHAMAAVESRNRVYAVGGVTGGATVASLYEYNPTSNAWSSLAPIRDASSVDQPRRSAVALVIADRVYVAGGHSGAGEQNSMWEYNPVTNAWARRANMNAARYLHGGGVINGRGYVYGGLPNSSLSLGEEFTAPVFPPPNQDPVANAGADQVVQATSPDGAMVTFNGHGSTDPEGGLLSFSWSGPFATPLTGPAPTALLAIGSHVVTLTVTDPEGATDTDTVSIVVQDMAPPAITLSATPESLEANGGLTKVKISVQTADGEPCALAQVISIASNQPSGSEPDWRIDSALSVRLREKCTNNEVRVYTITVRVTDDSGNSSTASIDVSVTPKAQTAQASGKKK